MLVRGCLFWIIFIFCISLVVCLDSFDPYRVLGVRRTATESEIKRAYKQLARKWHPDKNQSPEAEDRFVQINQAYELLTDPKRKDRYDKYGTTEETHEHDGQFHPFSDIFGGQFRFNTKPSFFNNHRINWRMYDTIVEKSFFVPYLIFVYSDWCMLCMRAEGIWERVVNELEPLGYGIATVNSMREGGLIQKLRVTQEPSIVALVEGRPVSYRPHVIDVRTIIDFARSSIPSEFVTTLNDANFHQWMMDNWKQHNKLSVIMSGPQDRPRLRFVLIAMRYGQYAKFGYVPLKSLSTNEFRSTYGVSTSTKQSGGLENFMIFNEHLNSPLVSIQAKEIPTESLISALESNKFLIVPRLSSQQLFDELCPSVASLKLRQLCVILIIRSKSNPPDDQHLIGYREFVEKMFIQENEIRYVYLYEDKQWDFMKSLISAKNSEKNADPERKDIVILWRTSKQRAQLEWLKGVWSGHAELVNRSGEVLRSKLERIVHQGDGLLNVKVDLTLLIDENGPTWYLRTWSKLTNIWESLLHYLSKEELFPMISVFGTLFVMLILGYCVNYVTDAKKNPNTRRDSGSLNQPGKSDPSYRAGKDGCFDSGLHLRELNSGTYSEMVTNSHRGVRTIVILVTEKTKEELLRKFSQYLTPWKGEQNVLFGFINLDKNFDWFRLLWSSTQTDSSLPDRAILRNPGHASGIVLSLNGFRKCFNIYYPSNKRRHRKMGATGDRQFLGFDSSSSSSSDEENTDLLDGLQYWLERSFEGCCPKFTISEWPSIM